MLPVAVINVPNVVGVNYNINRDYSTSFDPNGLQIVAVE